MTNQKDELPEFIVAELPRLPRYADRRTLADIVSRLMFPVSHRTIESWPLCLTRANGRAVADTREALAYAWAKFQAGARTMGGRHVREHA